MALDNRKAKFEQDLKIWLGDLNAISEKCRGYGKKYKNLAENAGLREDLRQSIEANASFAQEIVKLILKQNEEIIRDEFRLDNLQKRFVEGEQEDQLKLAIAKGQTRILEQISSIKWVGAASKAKKILADQNETIELLEYRVENRPYVTESMKEISAKATTFKKHHLGDIFSKMPSADLINTCKAMSQIIWSKDKDMYLEPKYIIDNFTQSLQIIAACDRLGAELKKHPKLKNDEIVETLQVLQYYKYHVAVILADFDMHLDDLSLKDDAVSKRLNRNKPTYFVANWAEDFKIYQALLNKDKKPFEKRSFSKPSDVRLKEMEQLTFNKENLKVDEDKQDLEGAKANQLETIQEGNEQIIRLDQEQFEQLDRSKNHKKVVNRLQAIYKQLTKRVQATKDIDYNKSAFAGIEKFFEVYKKSFADNENMDEATKRYKVDKDLFFQDLIKQIEICMKPTSKLAEKQCAGVILDFLYRETNGNLPIPASCYIGKDTAFVDMEKPIQDEAYDEAYVCSFSSVKKQTLFPHEPCLTDVSQGHLGDCYFISAIGNIVANNPEYIKSMMRDNMDGTVTVRFYSKASSDVIVPVYIKISKTIPKRTFQKSKVVMDGGSDGALWLKLLEKAYALLLNNADQRQLGLKDKTSYSSIVGGVYSNALTHLLGVEASIDDFVGNKTGCPVFKGRLLGNPVATFGKKKIDTPALLLYYNKHLKDKDDNEAFLYFSQKKGKSQAFKDEISYYQAVEKLIEKSMEILVEKDKWNTRDLYSFCNAADQLTEKLNKFLDKLSKESLPEMSAATLKKISLPEKLHSVFLACFKDQTVTAEGLKITIQDMIKVYKERLIIDNKEAPYTPSELALYEKIAAYTANHRLCNLGTKDFGSAGSKDNNKAGVYGKHSYAVLRAEEHILDGTKRKFFRLFNPAAEGIPIYKLDDRGLLHRAEFSSQTSEDKSYERSAHGVFLLELRDAYNLAEQMCYSNSSV